MKALNGFSKKFPLLVGLIMLAYAWFGVQCIPQPIEGDLGWALKELILVAICVALTLLLLGPSLFQPSSKGMRYARRKSRYYLILNVGVFGLLFLVYQFAGNAASGTMPDYIGPFFLAFVLAASIGIFEELVFRVFLFGGLSAKMGSTRAGIVGAAVISSLIFGFIHVASSLLGEVAFTPGYILQLVGKTVQSGIMGFFLCALYVKTRNFWYIAGIHLLSDFFVLWGSFANGAATGDYAGDGGSSALLYFIVILLNIPVIVTSVKMFLGCVPPQHGPLVEDEYPPCDPADAVNTLQ